MPIYFNADDFHFMYIQACCIVYPVHDDMPAQCFAVHNMDVSLTKSLKHLFDIVNRFTRRRRLVCKQLTTLFAAAAAVRHVMKNQE